MKTYILISIGLFFSLFTQAQIGIGTISPNSSSALEVQSTTQGLLIPRMTQVQLEAIATPAKGLIVYCLDCQEEGLYINIGDGVIPAWNYTPGHLLNTVVNSLAEVLEDSAVGSNNANETPVSLIQIETTGVTGVVAASLVRYQIAIAAETGFSNPATVAELQAIIDAVNIIVNALGEVLEDSDSQGGANNDNGNVVTFSQLQDIELTDLNAANLGAYQAAIAAEAAFSSPAIEAEVQDIITGINAAVIAAFLEILEDSNSLNGGQNANGIAVTFAQLQLTAVNNLNQNYLAGYQNSLHVVLTFSTPPTIPQIQAIINYVNGVELLALEEALEEVLEDSAGGSANANVTLVSLNQIETTGATGVIPGNLINYQAAIAAETGFSNPVLLAELQDIIDTVNIIQNALSEVLEDSASTGGFSNINGTSVTLSQLQDIGLTGLNANNLSAYQAAITAEAGFSNPVLVADVQSIIAKVNALVEVLEDSNSSGGANNINGTPVSFAQINNTGVTGAVAGLLAYYQSDIAAETGFSSPPTTGEIQAIIDAGHDTTTTIVDVITLTGRVWMDRNLGATQVATSFNDTAAYGDLYQWGRRKDGHESRANTNYNAGPVTATNEGSNFLQNAANWLTPADNTRWNGATKGLHDPCPTGYRVPTIAEFQAEIAQFSNANSAGAFASALKLTAGGVRDWNNGNVNGLDSSVYYYSSSNVSAVMFNAGTTDTIVLHAGYACSVRCIKEQ